MRVRHALFFAILAGGFTAPACAEEERWKVVRVEGNNGGMYVNLSRDGKSRLNLADDVVRGSGRIARQTRQVGSFTRIEADDATNVEVAIGPRASIEIEADDNLLQNLTTEVEGGTLRISSTGSYATNNVPVVRIVTPNVEDITLRGSGDGTIRGLSGGSLEIVTMGSGDIRAEGQLKNIDLTMLGSGDADLTALQASVVKLVINGSGDADVGTPEVLSATVNGSGNVSYDRNIEVLQVAVNGSGRVRGRSTQ